MKFASPEDAEKASFTTVDALYTWNVMPFGLCNAPSVFQHLMSEVLDGLDDFSCAYFDDILIYSSSLDEHLAHIQAVFDRLRQHHLKLKLKKCKFMMQSTIYLGFVVGSNGINPDPEKVQATRDIPTPLTVTDVRAIIGTCSYYRRFIPKFSEIARPLIALTRKNIKFVWDAQCQEAFCSLKERLAQAPLLAFPDTSKPYILTTDASDKCIGAC